MAISRGARRSLMDSFGPVQSMPPTAWRTKTGTPNPTPKPVYPNDLPVVRRLSSSASLPDVLAHKLPQAPNRRDVREIRAALGTDTLARPQSVRGRWGSTVTWKSA